MDIDAFAPRLSFFWAIGMNHFMEIAKMRAARMIWAKLVKQFNPKNPKSMALRTHSQTSGWSLPSRIRLTMWAAPLLKQWQQHWVTPRVCIPTRLTKQLLCQPISRHVLHAIRKFIFSRKLKSAARLIPWAGSYYVETLTHEIAQKAWALIEEVEKLGGMAKAIETGVPKMRIEEAAARAQGKIDGGTQTIVGINKYRRKRRPD
jgi:methylmalonyl-CoA mutase